MASEDREGPAHAPTVGDTAAPATSSEPEHAYRHGYCQGWEAGIGRLRNLMFDDMLSRQAAYDACWSYWHRELFEWYDGFRHALTSEHPLTAPEPEAPNVSRRRGYRDGWIEGIDAMWDLMFAHGMTREPAHARCREHLEQALNPWRDGDCGTMVIPPPMERRGE